MGRVSDVDVFGEGAKTHAPGLCLSWVRPCRLPGCERGSHEIPISFSGIDEVLYSVATDVAIDLGWAVALGVSA